MSEVRRQRGYRYVDLERVAKRARSSGWFNNLLNGSSPWQVGPPSADTLARLAELLETTQAHVCEMVAEEWYGVARTEQSKRVAALAPRIDDLTEDDADFVEQLVQRLLKDSREAETLKAPHKPVKRLKKRPAA